MNKSLAIGNSSFVMMRRFGNYYVDKTAFLKPVLESGSVVQLITRPRRFGKSLFMDTLRAFLTVPPEGAEGVPQAELFAGLDVERDKAFCERFMGKVPVLFLSMKSVEGMSFDSAFEQLQAMLARKAQEYDYLLESPRLTLRDKERLRAYIDWRAQDVGAASRFPIDMVSFLAKHHGRQVMLLIDEYDVPLHWASVRGYYPEMLGFMRAFFGVLKPEDGPFVDQMPVLWKAVLTGCLRVSKESLFTGVNNFTVNTVCSGFEPYAAAIGFTEAETEALLNYCGLEERREDVRSWYDGYRFGEREIYCPWDVLNFCRAAQGSSSPATYPPENFWAGTSGNEAIEEFLGFLSEEDAGRMQTLLDGGEIEIDLNEQLTYTDFTQHRSEDFWTLLLFTGYLTVSQRLDGKTFRLRIPNQEIRETFKEGVEARFSKRNEVFAQHGVKLAQAAVTGDVVGMAEVLEPLLRGYVSVRDAASRAPAENYYHGFLSALLACAGGIVSDFRSNAEAGDGYADLIFSTGTGPNRLGVVIEVKRVGRAEALLGAADEALRQIDDRKYAEALRRMRCRRYYAYGIAFCGKSCEVGGGELRTLEF